MLPLETGNVEGFVIKMSSPLYTQLVEKEVFFSCWRKVEQFLAEQDQLAEDERWGLEFFTAIKTTSGQRRLDLGAGPIVIGTEMYAYLCDCGATYWSRTFEVHKVVCADCNY